VLHYIENRGSGFRGQGSKEFSSFVLSIGSWVSTQNSKLKTQNSKCKTSSFLAERLSAAMH
jgi:hypothetical protein